MLLLARLVAKECRRLCGLLNTIKWRGPDPAPRAMGAPRCVPAGVPGYRVVPGWVPVGCRVGRGRGGNGVVRGGSGMGSIWGGIGPYWAILGHIRCI